MKYKWIELQGYAGIFNGMNLTNIKIDFTQCKTNKILIKGDNGSGKSTLVNAINPNPDGGDCFIPGAEARKNLCLTNNGIDYVIRYIHPVNQNGVRGVTKAYIAKTINGQLVELNPNGNVTSCKDIIYDEFNLDNNFISLSKLSSENRGLVDNRPSDRKRIVNSILNIVEVYNGIYKKISKKVSSLKHLMNTITYKINSLGDKIKLDAELKNTEESIAKLEIEKNKTIEAIALTKLRIDEYLTILRSNNYDAIVTELNELSTHNKVLRQKIQTKITDFKIKDINSVESFLEYLQRQIIILENNIANLKENNVSLLSQREIEFNDLKNKQERLQSLQNEYNYIDIKRIIEESTKIVDEYADTINNMGLKNLNITKEEFNSAMESLRYLKDLSMNLSSTYHYNELEFVIHNFEYVVNELAKTDKIKQEIESLKLQKDQISKQITVYESKQDLINELNNRPDNCKIDTCPYIESALKASYEYPREELERYYNEFNSLETEINDKTRYLDKLNIFREIVMKISSIKRELDSKMNFIRKLPVREDFKETFLERIINCDSFSDIDNLYRYIDCGNIIEQYKLALLQLEKYQSEYKLYETKNSIIQSMIQDIEYLTNKTNSMADEIENNNKQVSENNLKLQEMKNIETKISLLISQINNDLKPSEERELKLKQIKEQIDASTTELNDLQDNLYKLNDILASANNNIKILNSNKEEITHKLLQLDEYNKELEQYRVEYTKLEKIKYYSSPSTGIQTLFIQLYMNKILSNVNTLLSLLFNGEFVIQPFIINENEFRIPCMGSGLLHDDISSMSTAQKSMISMILSFAMLYQSSTSYNIIMLDEIDGGLDTSNRGMFIELLDNLMNMLNCEQCFMISHNNELNTALCDIIVLKNTSNEIYNGNIIWQY